METKSRYEIMSELEERKAKLMNIKASIGITEAELNRNIEMAQEKLKEFLQGKDIQLKNADDQIESIEKSLKRLDSQKK